MACFDFVLNMAITEKGQEKFREWHKESDDIVDSDELTSELVSYVKKKVNNYSENCRLQGKIQL